MYRPEHPSAPGARINQQSPHEFLEKPGGGLYSDFTWLGGKQNLCLSYSSTDGPLKDKFNLEK